MDNKKGYNSWAETYDYDPNKTRDLEHAAVKESLQNFNFPKILEIGCGTGKNTMWLLDHGTDITAVDFSEEMVRRASEKIVNDNVHFIIADVSKEWTFTDRKYDLITFSLVLEHIEKLGHIFSSAFKHLNPGGIIYVGELHPYKQYLGTKARFTRGGESHILDCFTHNISDFVNSAKKNSLELLDMKEFFHEDDSELIPRIITFLFRKPFC